jgi:hypothetical protein
MVYGQLALEMKGIHVLAVLSMLPGRRMTYSDTVPEANLQNGR